MAEGTDDSGEVPAQHHDQSPPPKPVSNNNNNGEIEFTFEKIGMQNGVSSSKATILVKASSVSEPASNSEDVSDSVGASSSNISNNRRHSKSSSLPHGVKLCPEGHEATGAVPNGPISSPAEEKWVKLEAELRKAHVDLRAKDDEVEQLKGNRQLMEEELHDLTSSLFVEAHKMVSEAKMKEISSEKSLREARMQLEGLQAEVAALKTLLITSTPSRPNLGGGSGISIFKKQHKRTPSHNHLLFYGRTDEADGKTSEGDAGLKGVDPSREVDPVFHLLFSQWRESPTLVKNQSDFLKRIYAEDIEPCLNFQNEDLVKRLAAAIEENSVWVEPLPEKNKSNVQSKCALLQVQRLCHYRMSFAFDSDEWFDISQLCRDRVAAVCEFLNYLRYIQNGLVKASVDESYWEIIRLRKQMALAKLGLAS